MVNLRDKVHNIFGRLFQAAMWRQEAMKWDSPNPWVRDWAEKVLKKSREECLRRARINIYLARRLNRREKELRDGGTFESGKS